MVDENILREARENGEEVESGLIWDTYILEDSVIQIPRENEEWRIGRVKDIYGQLSEDVPKPAMKKAEDKGSLQGVVYDRVEGEMLRDLKRSLEGLEEDTGKFRDLRARYLDAIEKAGEALAHIHSSDVEGSGYGYFNRENGNIEAPHGTWREYVENQLEDLDNIPERFKEAAELALDNFEIEKIPDEPGRSILHDDFNSGNIIVRGNGAVTVFDFDNAIYGDANFGFINSKNELCDYDDREAHERFEQGYKSVRDLDLNKEARENYTALAILDSVSAGKWIHENRNVEFLDSYAEDVNEWARDYFS